MIQPLVWLLRNTSILSLLVLFCAFLGSSYPAHAVMVDSDLDGITDWGETTIYHTDPQKADTDGDGISDSKEIIDQTDPLDAKSSKLLLLERRSGDPGIMSTVSTSIAWYVGRAAGIISFILLTFVVVNGLLISSRVGMRFIPPALNLELHRFASWVLILMVLLHGISFMFDHFIHLTWLEFFVPMQAKRDFLSALGFDMNIAIALGIIGIYSIILLVLTSEIRQKISIKVWRRIHYTSFAGYILIVFHGVMAGTDSPFNWTRVMYIVSGVLVVILTVLRVRSAIVMKKKIAEAKAKQALSQAIVPPVTQV